jgi:hypothetical protein
MKFCQIIAVLYSQKKRENLKPKDFWGPGLICVKKDPEILKKILLHIVSRTFRSEKKGSILPGYYMWGLPVFYKKHFCFALFSLLGGIGGWSLKKKFTYPKI